LGLAISKSYAEVLVGNIWVESTIGEGSVFYSAISLTGFSECFGMNREVLKGHILDVVVLIFNGVLGAFNVCL